MAPRGYLQRGALPGRRAIFEEGLEGLSRSGQDKYTTEVVLQNFNSQLTMLDRAGDRAGGELGSDEDDFGASGPSTREKKPAMAGAGKRGDMDDEIPF